MPARMVRCPTDKGHIRVRIPPPATPPKMTLDRNVKVCIMGIQFQEVFGEVSSSGKTPGRAR